MSAGNVAAGVDVHTRKIKDGIVIGGSVKGAVGVGASASAEISLHNPYSKDFRKKNFNSIKNDVKSKDPKKVARGVGNAILDHNPTAIATRALGFKADTKAEKVIEKIPVVNTVYALADKFKFWLQDLKTFNKLGYHEALYNLKRQEEALE